MRLAQLPRLPSEIWNLKAQGYSHDECLEFDLAHLRFWDWFEGKKHEEEWGTAPKTPKGKVRVPKYKTDADILTLYYEDRVHARVDPVAASITDDDLISIMDDLFVVDDESERAEPDAAGEG